MIKKLLCTLALAVTCTFAVAPVHADIHLERVEDAIEYRQAAFVLMSDYFDGRLGPVVRGEVDFNVEKVSNNIEVLKVLVNLPWAGFGEGTEGGYSEDSLWINKVDFDNKAQASIVAVAVLEEAAESGDLKKFKAAFANTAKSCKTCHDSYRK